MSSLPMDRSENKQLSKELNGSFYFYSISEFHLRSGNETQPTGNNFISLFLKGPVQLLGIVTAGAEMRRESRALGEPGLPHQRS